MAKNGLPFKPLFNGMYHCDSKKVKPHAFPVQITALCSFTKSRQPNEHRHIHVYSGPNECNQTMVVL